MIGGFVGVALLAVVLLRADLPSVGRALAGTRPGWVALACLLHVTAVSASTIRWSWILRASGHSLPFGGLVRAQLAGFALNRIVPTTIAGDGARAEWVRRSGVPGPTAVASVVLDRVLGVLGLALVGSVPAVLQFVRTGEPEAAAAVAVLATTAVGAGAVLASERIVRWTVRVLTRLGLPVVAAALDRIGAAVRVHRAHRGTVAASIAVAMAFHCAAALVFWMLGRSVAIDLGPGPYFVAVPLFFLVSQTPVTPGGIGFREAAFVGWAAHVAVDPARAAAVTVLWIFVTLSTGAIGAGVVLAARLRRVRG